MTRCSSTHGAPHSSPRWWTLICGLLGGGLLTGGCVYDWTVPEPTGETGGGPSTGGSTSASGGAGGTGTTTSNSGGAGAGGQGGGQGGGGGAGGMTPLCSASASCELCIACVIDDLPGTQQDCVLYDACVVACGADLGCQNNCTTTFAPGYDIQLELLQQCNDLCPGVPTCI